MGTGGADRIDSVIGVELSADLLAPTPNAAGAGESAQAVTTTKDEYETILEPIMMQSMSPIRT
jgi:hypothetical protein